MNTKKETYTKEFKAEAVKLVLEQGLSIEEATRRLDLAKSTFGRWVREARVGSVKRDTEVGAQSAADLANENKQLRKELAEARMERDILKKAAAYFAKESLPGTL